MARSPTEEGAPELSMTARSSGPVCKENPWDNITHQLLCGKPQWGEAWAGTPWAEAAVGLHDAAPRGLVTSCLPLPGVVRKRSITP